MAKPRYSNGIAWCRHGQHYVGDTDIKVANKGKKYCLEHKFRIRGKPRGKKWKAKYYDRLKTQLS